MTGMLDVLAQVRVRILDDPDPGMYEWLLFAATAIAAVGTLGAIAVALFGPAWRARSRLPRLTITAVEVLGAQRVSDTLPPDDALHLLVHNESGRDTAREVEVFVTASAKDPDSDREQRNVAAEEQRSVAAVQENLNFENPLEGHYGTVAATVPAGFSRRIHFAVIGSALAIQRACYQAKDSRGVPAPHCVGALSLFPARNDRIGYLLPDRDYDINLVITGANIDALKYRGVVRARIQDRTDGEPVGWIEWTDTPRPVSNHGGA